MPLVLPDLPFAKDALEPHMSAETLSFHHGKHHSSYVEKGNELLDKAGIDGSDPAELVRQVSDRTGPLYNNVVQCYNHSFFWNSLSPGGGGEPTGELGERIKSDFDDYASFRDEFISCGTGRFGSGWVWLVDTGRKLKVVSTANADSPLTEGMTPLLVCDVWEHAYYLDYQNRRKVFLETFIDKLANWRFAAANLEASRNG